MLIVAVLMVKPSLEFFALTFALFKEDRGSGRQEADRMKRLIHAEADALSVCFEFDLGAERPRLALADSVHANVRREHGRLQPADEMHPFGYGRAVYFWSFMVALKASRSILIRSAGMSGGATNGRPMPWPA